MSLMSAAGLSAKNRTHCWRASIGSTVRSRSTMRPRVLGAPRPRAQRLVRYWPTAAGSPGSDADVYVAVPLSASVPEEWRADLWRAAARAYAPCYIAGWSACEHWGLTEQIFRDLMVVSARPIGFRKDCDPGHAGEDQGRRPREDVRDGGRVARVGARRGLGPLAHDRRPPRRSVDGRRDSSRGGGARRSTSMARTGTRSCCWTTASDSATAASTNASATCSKRSASTSPT